MAHIQQDTVRYLAQLSKIGCTEQEEQSLVADLEKILSYVEFLDEVATEGVEPLAYVLRKENLHTPLREDIVVSTLSTQDFLKTAPQQVAGMVKVPTIMKSGQES